MARPGAERIVKLGETAQGSEARDVEIQLSIGQRPARIDELGLIDLTEVAFARGDAKGAGCRFDPLGCGAERGLRQFEVLQRPLHFEADRLLLECAAGARLALRRACTRDARLVRTAGE